MHRICLLLLGMASLVASGVIMDRGRVGFDATGNLGLQSVQNGYSKCVKGGCGNALTKDELLRQKFILDILHHIYMPLQQQDLLTLEDRNTITNENLYVRPLTKEMYIVLDLIRNNQILGKHTTCNINNKQHVQQAVGLYKLLVTAQDFDTFMRLVVYARQNVSTELFVNCLVLALGDRQDTQMLIVPALHEILPQLFIKDNVIDQVRRLDTGVSSVKPQLMDVLGTGRRNFLFNSYFNDQQQQQQQGGLFDILTKSQMWMPWRELHKQLAVTKMTGRNVVQQYDEQMDKLVITLPGNGLLSQDLGLKSYVTILIDEILLNQDTVRNQYSSNQQIKYADRMSGVRGYHAGGEQYNNIYDTNTQYDNIYDANTYYGKMYGGQRYYNRQEDSNAGKYWRYNDYDELNQNNYGRQYDMDRNTYNVQNGQRGINTVSANDARLLFVGRRHQNPNSVVNTDYNRYDEDDLISGGRKVVNEDFNDKRQRSKYYKDDGDVTLGDVKEINRDYYTNIHKQGLMMDCSNYENTPTYYYDCINRNTQGRVGRGINNDEDDLYWNRNRGIDSYDYMNRNCQDRGVDCDKRVDNGRYDFLNMVTKGRMGQRQYFNKDQDLLWNRDWTGQKQYGESLDVNLPTTNINDERLLYINRRKANKNVMGVDDDVYDRYSRGYERGNINMEQSQFDEQSQWGKSRQRRSIVNQGLGQAETINGRLLLHSLQQLVAHLNMERIALGQPQLIDETQYNYGHGILTTNIVGNNAVNGVDVYTINKIEDIIQQLDNVLQQKIGQTYGSSYKQTINEIGLVLAGQIQGAGLSDILGEILQQTNQQWRKGLVANLIENKAAQVLLAGIVKMVDQKVQQGFCQRKELVTDVQGLNINNVEVDKLKTYVEQTDVDLTNLLDTYTNVDQTIQGKNKVVVGRIPRLNHKTFNIKIDVTSDRQQQVVVRNLLVPMVDGQNNIIPLEERRKNVIVLDINTVELQQGRNILKLNSNDVTTTSCDTTPLTKIYKYVMKALNGDITLQQDALVGQTTLLPHRLLLPRGRANGLPMQLITVITPVQGYSGYVSTQKETGLNAFLLDNLPLNYPLHCDITDLDKVSSMPNLMVKDVKIYHDDGIQTNYLY